MSYRFFANMFATLLFISTAWIFYALSIIESNGETIKQLNEEITYQQSIIDSISGDCITLEFKKEEN